MVTTETDIADVPTEVTTLSDGNIRIEFRIPIKSIDLYPESAITLARTLLDHAGGTEPPSDEDESRRRFEEVIYQEYFAAMVEVLPGGGLTTGADTKTRAELLARDADGDYSDGDIDAMWYGWCMARKQ